jgi:hypothetical protein
MRVRVSKFVYLPVGGALGAGLLVSALVAPQQQLLASSNCYGACHSVTTLSLSKTDPMFGRENEEEFTVKVRAETASDGEPTGAVEVRKGDRVLCTANLDHGEARCHLTDRELAPDSYDVVADYLGDTNFKPSRSDAEHFDVSRISTRTDLTLSKSTVTFGKEAEEEFKITVHADNDADGAPAGEVFVKLGDRELCHVDLRDGEGRCRLTDRELAPGEYEIDAHFHTGWNFFASTSDKQHLKVDRKR